MNTADLITEAASLPLEERIRLEMSPSDESSTAKWLTVAKRRLDEIDSGQIAPVDGEVVFERARQKSIQHDNFVGISKGECNLRLIREIEANREFLLMAYRQNPALLARAEPRIKELFASKPAETTPALGTKA